MTAQKHFVFSTGFWGRCPSGEICKYLYIWSGRDIKRGHFIMIIFSQNLCVLLNYIGYGYT